MAAIKRHRLKLELRYRGMHLTVDRVLPWRASRWLGTALAAGAGSTIAAWLTSW